MPHFSKLQDDQPLGSTPDSVDWKAASHTIKLIHMPCRRRMSNTSSSSILKDSSSCSPPCIIGNGKARGMSGGSLKDTVDLTKEHHTEESSSVKSNETTCSKNGENSLSSSSSGDFYSVTHAFRQTTGNKADGGQ